MSPERPSRALVMPCHLTKDPREGAVFRLPIRVPSRTARQSCTAQQAGRNVWLTRMAINIAKKMSETASCRVISFEIGA